MGDQSVDSVVKNSVLYHEFLAEREEIMKHKWFQSEAAGKDIGFDMALMDWMVHHRASWKKSRFLGSKHASALVRSSVGQ